MPTSSRRRAALELSVHSPVRQVKASQWAAQVRRASQAKVEEASAAAAAAAADVSEGSVRPANTAMERVLAVKRALERSWNRPPPDFVAEAETPRSPAEQREYEMATRLQSRMRGTLVCPPPLHLSSCFPRLPVPLSPLGRCGRSSPMASWARKAHRPRRLGTRVSPAPRLRMRCRLAMRVRSRCSCRCIHPTRSAHVSAHLAVRPLRCEWVKRVRVREASSPLPLLILHARVVTAPRAFIRPRQA